MHGGLLVSTFSFFAPVQVHAEGDQQPEPRVEDEELEELVEPGHPVAVLVPLEGVARQPSEDVDAERAERDDQPGRHCEVSCLRCSRRS